MNRGDIMDYLTKYDRAAFTYEPFWEWLEKERRTAYQLEDENGVNPALLSRLRDNHNFTIASLCKLSRQTGCPLERMVRLRTPEEIGDEV